MGKDITYQKMKEKQTEEDDTDDDAKKVELSKYSGKLCRLLLRSSTLLKSLEIALNSFKIN